MKNACVLVAILVLPAFAQETSWSDVGEMNIAKLRQLNEISKQMKGKHFTESLAAKIAQESMSYYASMMSCSVGKGSRFAIDLANVPVMDCWKALAKSWRNIKNIDFDMNRLAIDPTSGGKIIFARVPWEAIGVTDAGQEVPGTKMRGTDNYLYGFNDEGQIVRVDYDYDSGLIEDLRKKIISYETNGRAESWTDVGQQNVAKVTHLFRIATDGLLQKPMTQAMSEQMSDRISSFYAPTISCSQSKGTSIAVDLTDVPSWKCLNAKSELWANMKFIEMGLKKIAIDPQSDGQTILATVPYKMVGVTSNGEDVPDTYVHGMYNFRFDFDHEGKIVYSDSEFDSGIFEKTMANVERYTKKKGIQIQMAEQSTSQVLTMGVAFGLVVGLLSGAFITQWACKSRRGQVLSEPILG